MLKEKRDKSHKSFFLNKSEDRFLKLSIVWDLDIVIHDIHLIQYYCDVIHPIEFTLQAKDLSSLWD